MFCACLYFIIRNFLNKENNKKTTSLSLSINTLPKHSALVSEVRAKKFCCC